VTKEIGPACACGDTSAVTGGRKRIIIPCAGIANVGQISHRAALRLADEGYGVASCAALLGTGDAGLNMRIAEADELVLIDGCPATCTAKIAAAQGVVPAQHIVVTGLGIEKVYTRDIREDDVETVVCAAWEGKGRENND
jgi:uncharacterized metal-binding protein